MVSLKASYIAICYILPQYTFLCETKGVASPELMRRQPACLPQTSLDTIICNIWDQAYLGCIHSLDWTTGLEN